MLPLTICNVVDILIRCIITELDLVKQFHQCLIKMQQVDNRFNYVAVEVHCMCNEMLIT